MAHETSMHFLLLNLTLYIILTGFSSWAINRGIDVSHDAASRMKPPVQFSPIYFPMGNMATGFFVTYSLLVGVIGFTTSLSGIYNCLRKQKPLCASAASSLVSWALTALGMGLASKQISLSYTGTNLRTMETLMIILSVTQLVCTLTIHREAHHQKSDNS